MLDVRPGCLAAQTPSPQPRPTVLGDAAPLDLLTPHAAGAGGVFPAPLSLVTPQTRAWLRPGRRQHEGLPADRPAVPPLPGPAAHTPWRPAPHQGSVERRLDELGGLLEGLAEESGSHAQHLEVLARSCRSLHLRMDDLDAVQRSIAVGLETFQGGPGGRCAPPAAAPESAPQGARSPSEVAGLLEALEGQARAVGELGAMAREELQVAKALAEASGKAPASDPAVPELLGRVAEQGLAIERLSALVAGLGDGVAAAGAAAAPAAARAAELESAVANLEEAVSTMQDQLGMLITIVRSVADYAAGPLDDRLAASVEE
ncbi:unnamed protein product, partial [Prorocentrum cordatum]